MTEDQITFFEAELTALGFMVENLFAMVAVSHGADPAAVEALGRDMLRQFQTLPARTTSGEPAPANDTALRLQAAQAIARRMGAVRARVAQAPARPGQPG